MTRLLIVDDHALFRDTILRVLAAEPDLEVVAACGTVEEALAVVESRPVDLVLLDYDLGAQRGTDFLHAARAGTFTGRVIIVTAALSDVTAQTLIRQGIDGIFFKDKPLQALLESIRAVAAGMAWFEARHLRPVINREPDGVQKFNDRERQILKLITQGLTNKHIATQLGLSEAAVKAALQRIFQKTGAHTRGQLVRVVLEQYRDII